MRFNNFEYLLGIFLAIYFLWKWCYPKKSLVVKFPNINHLKNINKSFKLKAYKSLPFLKFLGISLLIIALARPQKGNILTKVTKPGIAIMMVVDISYSMKALDFSDENTRKNRLDVVKEVFRDFVIGNRDVGMKGRENDLIGLVVFGGIPESKCPLTLDHDALSKLINEVKIKEPIYDNKGQLVNGEELQTAIGDAIIVGFERLKNIQVKSKIMLLLTDGENNTGIYDPLDNLNLAKDLGIKIYTIGVGTTGRVPFPVKNEYGEEKIISSMVSIDEALLKQIAEKTKGKYFNALDKKGLQNIYKEIDKLERTEINTTYTEYEELYYIPLFIGLMILLFEKILSMTVLRKVP